MKHTKTEKVINMIISVKKLGEGCDTKGDGGVCGAVNSRCKNDVCVCDPDRPLLEERWGGEACFDWKTSLYPTESFRFVSYYLFNARKKVGRGGML